MWPTHAQRGNNRFPRTSPHVHVHSYAFQYERVRLCVGAKMCLFPTVTSGNVWSREFCARYEYAIPVFVCFVCVCVGPGHLAECSTLSTCVLVQHPVYLCVGAGRSRAQVHDSPFTLMCHQSLTLATRQRDPHTHTHTHTWDRHRGRIFPIYTHTQKLTHRQCIFTHAHLPSSFIM